MKVLVTGAHGQLGRDILRVMEEESPERHHVIGMGRHDLDIKAGQQVMTRFEEERPEIVIHAAAYTQVDQAESELDQAYAVNALGTRNVAVAAEKVGAKLIYISTDYVFDGCNKTPYTEFDAVNPQSVYGKSKRAGEEFVLALSRQHFIVRTSWVYGEYGANFVKTMLKLGKSGKPIQVVNDQMGSPTYTVDLARFLKNLMQTELYGIYHATNAGSCTWYEFACAIFEESGMEVELSPCTTQAFPRPAPRPAYSVLDHMGIRLSGLEDLRPWREALKAFLHFSVNI
ncbi:MAG: dTDP-4-dehydrorhamnose reductase [Desulfosporosinus sp.]|nr:dTDP-4-dehydrorhamnose reductase [Desulfosporosinus sp.]